MGGEGMQNSKMGLACHEAEGVQSLKVPRPYEDSTYSKDILKLNAE